MKICDVRGKYGVGHTVVDDDDEKRLEGKKLYAKPNGYIYFQIKRDGKYRNVYLHRFLIDAQTGKDVDHINGVRHDNRKSNLRQCSRSQNMANMQKPGKGIFHDNGRWVACVMCMYKGHRIGTFDTREEAVEAYKKKSRELFGDFAGGGYV